MEYRNPASTVDIIVEQEGKILLVKRKLGPYKGKWAIPGGFIECGKETLEEAALRELKEETGLAALKLKLFKVCSNPGRDPRGHIIAHVYIAETKGKGEIKAGDDAKEAKFFSISSLPELAFDHAKILIDYVRVRKAK